MFSLAVSLVMLPHNIMCYGTNLIDIYSTDESSGTEEETENTSKKGNSAIFHSYPFIRLLVWLWRLFEASGKILALAALFSFYWVCR